MKRSWLIGVSIIIIGYFVIMSRPIQNRYWSIMEFLNPQLSSEMDEAWKTKPNNYLLKQLKANNYLYSGTAAGILIKRKDKTLVPEFINLLKNDDIRVVGTAIESLGKINDPSAIPYLMKFVMQGSESIHYRTALLALSEMQYRPIIPEINKLAQTRIANDYRPQQYAIAMMANFDDLELENRIKQFSTNESPYIRISATHALEKIEARRKNAEQTSGK